VTIACPKSADATCTGRVVLRTGKKNVGSATFSIRAGKHRSVKVKASSGATLVATATAHDRSSATATTSAISCGCRRTAERRSPSHARSVAPRRAGGALIPSSMPILRRSHSLLSY
jgi:hypothetical protein